MKWLASILLALVVASGVPAAAPAQTSAASSAEADSVGELKSREEVKKEIAIVGATELPGSREWERKKSAKVAVISSMVMPGLGQLYNGRKWKTVIFTGTFTFFVATAWTERKKAQAFLVKRDGYPTNSAEWRNADLYYQFHRQQALDFVWWSGAIWLLNVLDAFVDAHLYDVRGVEPTMIKGSEMRYYGLSVDF